MKLLCDVENLIIQHMNEGVCMNAIDPSPDESYYQGFLQGLAVALKMIRTVKEDERGKAFRKALRERNSKTVSNNEL